MTGKYIIRRLSKHSVIEFTKDSIPFGQIYDYEGAVLPEVSGSMEIRPRAVRFAKSASNAVYAVFYKTSEDVFCNFFFTIDSCNAGEVVTICRCKGSQGVKKHWKPVISIIDDYTDRIKKLSYGESLEFSFKKLKE